MKKFVVLAALTISLWFKAFAADDSILLGQWVEIYSEGKRCPFAAYQYHENGLMNAAFVMCSSTDVQAANYTAKWTILEDSLKLELVSADKALEALLSEDLKVTYYQIIKLEPNNLVIKDKSSGEVFSYEKSQ